MWATAVLPARADGMGTGVNAAAGPLVARIASTARAMPLLSIRLISMLLSRGPQRLRPVGVVDGGTDGPRERFANETGRIHGARQAVSGT